MQRQKEAGTFAVDSDLRAVGVAALGGCCKGWPVTSCPLSAGVSNPVYFGTLPAV